MIMLKLDSNNAVFMPAWPSANITVINSRKKKTPMPINLPEAMLNDLQSPTTKFLARSERNSPNKVIMDATITLGIKLTNKRNIFEIAGTPSLSAAETDRNNIMKM